MQVRDICEGQVWVWRNQSDGTEHARRVVEVVEGRVRYVVDNEREVAAPVDEFFGALVTQRARLVRHAECCHSGSL